jgi:hypothetical protein
MLFIALLPKDGDRSRFQFAPATEFIAVFAGFS